MGPTPSTRNMIKELLIQERRLEEKNLLNGKGASRFRSSAAENKMPLKTLSFEALRTKSSSSVNQIHRNYVIDSNLS